MANHPFQCILLTNTDHKARPYWRISKETPFLGRSCKSILQRVWLQRKWRIIAVVSIKQRDWLFWNFSKIFIDAVAVTWTDKIIPSMQWVISFGISTSIFSSMCCTVLSASRMIYTASQEGQLPLIFSMLNNHSCPTMAVSQIIILTSVVIITSDLINLIKYSGLAIWFLRGLHMIGLLKLRYQEPNLPRPYKVNQN